jgi:hypothetical protein
MDRFKKSEMNFWANAYAVIAKAGVGAAAAFNDSVAVFVRPLAGGCPASSVGRWRPVGAGEFAGPCCPPL